MKKTLLGTFAMVCGLSLSGNTLINTSWADGQRTIQDLPNNSMAWFSSSSSGNVVVSPGSMTQLTGTGGRHIVAYFTEAGSPAVLAPGERLTMGFTVSFPLTAPSFGTNQFRFGVWDSQGQRVAVDNHGGTGTGTAIPAFSNYAGYAYSGPLSTTSTSSTSLYKRNTGTAGILIATIGVYSAIGTGIEAGAGPAFAGNTDYYGEMTLSRLLDDTMRVQLTLTDGTVTLIDLTTIDDSNPYFSFDSVGFQLGSNVADGFTLTRVEVAVVPEPSTFGVLFGLVALLAVYFKRRNRG